MDSNRSPAPSVTITVYLGRRIAALLIKLASTESSSLGGSLARIMVLLPGRGHAAMTTAPEIFLAKVLAFLDETA